MISIVIPAYNEERYIGRCLDAFVRQRVGEPFEVIVVDNRSTDATATITRSYKGRIPLRILREENRVRGAARRRGFAAALGDVILSTDADSVVPDDWVAMMAAKLRQQDGTVAVSSPIVVEDCSRTKNFVINSYYSGYIRIFRTLYRDSFLTGTTMGVKRDAYHAAGGFDARRDVAEDMDLTMRIRRLGHVDFVNTAPVKTSGRRFKGGLIRGYSSYVKALAFMMLYRDHIASLANFR